MSSILEFERYKGELNRQLLRRIGYTNGLHKIRRFARVVEYIYSIMPTSVGVLTEVLIREENKRAEGLGENDRQLSGKKYATGIIDVVQSLTLLEKFGPKIALSSQGYACHALNRHEEFIGGLDAFLFERTIQSDGECVLNILRLVSEGYNHVTDIGDALMKRFLALIEFKRRWVSDKVEDHFSKRTLGGLLDEAQKTLERALKPSLVKPLSHGRSVQKPSTRKSSTDIPPVEFFYKHTVNPRLEWLSDLGCLHVESGSLATVTEAGRNVLDQIRILGGWNEEFIFLPLDPWLASELNLPNLYPSGSDRDVTWRLVAARRLSQPLSSTLLLDDISLLERIKLIYPEVKLANFNEADALSLYEVFAAIEAAEGRVVPQSDFEQSLTKLVGTFPSEVFKLSKRRGRGLYIALKKSV
jgi:hypothetical protein